MTEELEIKISPCLRSGLCCKIAICPYGEANEKGGCKYLLTKYKGEGYEFFECARHDYIIQQPGHEFMPAFGEGCCMALANQFRRANMQALLDKKVNAREIIPAKYFNQ